MVGLATTSQENLEDKTEVPEPSSTDTFQFFNLIAIQFPVPCSRMHSFLFVILQFFVQWTAHCPILGRNVNSVGSIHFSSSNVWKIRGFLTVVMFVFVRTFKSFGMNAKTRSTLSMSRCSLNRALRITGGA